MSWGSAEKIHQDPTNRCRVICQKPFPHCKCQSLNSQLNTSVLLFDILVNGLVASRWRSRKLSWSGHSALNCKGVCNCSCRTKKYTAIRWWRWRHYEPLSQVILRRWLHCATLCHREILGMAMPPYQVRARSCPSQWGQWREVIEREKEGVGQCEELLVVPGRLIATPRSIVR